MTNKGIPSSWAKVPAPSQGATAIRRVSKEPIYDKEYVGGDHQRVLFFVDHRKFLNGQHKTINDTNMVLDMCLGAPLEFDLLQFGVYPASGDDKYADYYHKFVHSDAVIEIIIGQQTILQRIPVALMTPKGTASPYVKDAVTGRRYQIITVNGKVDAVPAMESPGAKVNPMIHWEEEPKLTPRTYSAITGTRDGALQVHRIDSTEQFRVEIVQKKPFSDEQIPVFVALEGWLLKGI